MDIWDLNWQWLSRDCLMPISVIKYYLSANWLFKAFFICSEHVCLLCVAFKFIKYSKRDYKLLRKLFLECDELSIVRIQSECYRHFECQTLVRFSTYLYLGLHKLRTAKKGIKSTLRSFLEEEIKILLAVLRNLCILKICPHLNSFDNRRHLRPISTEPWKLSNS